MFGSSPVAGPAGAGPGTVTDAELWVDPAAWDGLLERVRAASLDLFPMEPQPQPEPDR